MKIWARYKVSAMERDANLPRHIRKITWLSALVLFNLSNTGLHASLIEDKPIVISFEGMGRLYSLEDEVAKPMCQKNKLHNGEFLIHYSRIGSKNNNEHLYPFTIYVPAEISLKSNIIFLSCIDEKAKCRNSSVKSGARRSRMHHFVDTGIGPHLLVIGASHSPDEIYRFSTIIKNLNHSYRQSINQDTDKYTLNIDTISRNLMQEMKGHIAHKMFQVINPGQCGS